MADALIAGQAARVTAQKPLVSPNALRLHIAEATAIHVRPVCVYKYVRWGRRRHEAHGGQGVGGIEGLLELYPGVQKGIPDDLKRRCYQMACGKIGRRSEEYVPFDGISRGLYGDLALSLPEERQQEHWARGTSCLLRLAFVLRA